MTAESASTTLGTTTKTAEGAPVNGAAQVITLVIGARKGDQQAWNALVERYSSLVWSICRRHRLTRLRLSSGSVYYGQGFTATTAAASAITGNKEAA
jgi:hypothetical protein